MKKGIKLAAVALLFLAGTESVFAGPFSRAFQARGERQQRAAVQQDDRQQQADPRRPGFAPGAPPELGGAGNPANAANRPPDQMRRMGAHMTVEERRALRRQINEAGHDIYTPKK